MWLSPEMKQLNFAAIPSIEEHVYWQLIAFHGPGIIEIDGILLQSNKQPSEMTL